LNEKDDTFSPEFTSFYVKLGVRIYLIDSNNSMISENIVSNNGWGIYLGYSNNNILKDNNADSNNVFGTHLAESSSNLINNNTASNNMVGIMLNYECNNNELTKNTVNSNNDYGIIFRHSINNKLNDNLICNNHNGICLFDSGGNFIYNNFFKNTDNFVVDKFSSNICYTSKTQGPNIVGGPFVGGNDWTQPGGGGFSQNCTDANNDGICDSPYNIDNKNIDYLPLTINASIDVEKYTNGLDADKVKGPEIKVGNQVTWTYNVTNTGNLTLNNITVTDDKLGEISCSKTTLEPGESVICTANSTSQSGQYSSLGNVTAICKKELCGGIILDDSDPSHYFGATPSIDIELYCNGEDADQPRGPTMQKMNQVKWTYDVTNTGNINLTDIKITNSENMEVNNPKDTLNVSESIVCNTTENAKLGQHNNYGNVTAMYEGTLVNDSDSSPYFGYDHWVDVPTTNPIFLICMLCIAMLLSLRRKQK
ncbi:MAG: NosD domain-containing protein, partial [Methanohalobium sp.]|uniref:NosD domain-containing protein n=1 Tax=Methanohalobium sp. TaxID=2837493 RepID=UPI00397C5733